MILNRLALLGALLLYQTIPSTLAMAESAVPGSLQVAESISKTLAVLGAGLFFLYRAVAGFLNLNCSIALALERHPLRAGEVDLLLATVTLSKKGNGALVLQGLEVVFNRDYDRAMSLIGDAGRLAVSPKQCAATWSGSSGLARHPVWGKQAHRKPHLILSPDETTTFACYAEVPAGRPCIVEVAAVGKRRLTSFIAQWRASAVSPPRSAPV